MREKREKDRVGVEGEQNKTLSRPELVHICLLSLLSLSFVQKKRTYSDAPFAVQKSTTLLFQRAIPLLSKDKGEADAHCLFGYPSLSRFTFPLPFLSLLLWQYGEDHAFVPTRAER